jgi:HicB-like protein involved in pilus formation
MKMSLVIEGFQADVVAVGELGDDAVAEVADRIASVFTRSAPTRILSLLSDVAAELSSELPSGRIEIRLVGDDVEFAYVDEETARPEGDAELSARITLRLSEQLKARVEESAARESTSVNGWIVRTLERGIATSKVRNGRPGSRLRGYGTS